MSGIKSHVQECSMRPRRQVSHQPHSARFYVGNSSSDLGISSDDSLQDFSVDSFVNITSITLPRHEGQKKKSASPNLAVPAFEDNKLQQ